MNKQREELDSALEALQNEMRETISKLDPKEMVTLLSPRKPVAWMLMDDTHCHIMATDWKPEDSDGWKTMPLYTAPSSLKITEKEINDICSTSCSAIHAVIKMMVKFNIQLVDKNNSIQQWIKDEADEQTT